MIVPFTNRLIAAAKTAPRSHLRSYTSIININNINNSNNNNNNNNTNAITNKRFMSHVNPADPKVCKGANPYSQGEDPKILADSEYPDWVFKLHERPEG